MSANRPTGASGVTIVPAAGVASTVPPYAANEITPANAIAHANFDFISPPCRLT